MEITKKLDELHKECYFIFGSVRKNKINISDWDKEQNNKESAIKFSKEDVRSLKKLLTSVED